jgi:hypothetical protein
LNQVEPRGEILAFRRPEEVVVTVGPGMLHLVIIKNHIAPTILAKNHHNEGIRLKAMTQ